MEDELKIKVAVMQNDIKNICKKMDIGDERNVSEHKEIKDLIQNFINNADKKYASKLTEKVVYTLCGVILVSVIYLILKSVGIK